MPEIPKTQTPTVLSICRQTKGSGTSGAFCINQINLSKNQALAKAKTIFESILLNQKVTEEQLNKVCCILAKAARISHDDAAFIKYTTKSLVMGGSSEICLELGEYFLSKKDNEEAIVWFYNAAYESEPILDVASQGKAPRLGLAQCYANIAKELGYSTFEGDEDLKSHKEAPQDVSAILELHKQYLKEAMDWEMPEES